MRNFRAPVLRMPLVRRVRCMQLRRLRPLADGRQRGLPIVRYYWTEFLERHSDAIRGHCIEVGTTETIRFHGGNALVQADAIDLARHSAEITIVADLTSPDSVPSDRYDCFVNQFTMHLIYDIESALYHSVRMLKPGGVLLVNFPCVEYSFAHGLDMGTGEPLFVFWQFTQFHVENLLRRTGLDAGDFELELHGNLFTRIAYQMNIPTEELTREELDHVDSGHPLLICVRATKPHGWRSEKPIHRRPWLPSVTPARWDPVRGHYAP